VNTGLRNLASKLETSLYAVVHNIEFDVQFRSGSPVWQTDRRTDGRCLLTNICKYLQIFVNQLQISPN